MLHITKVPSVELNSARVLLDYERLTTSSRFRICKWPFPPLKTNLLNVQLASREWRPKIYKKKEKRRIRTVIVYSLCNSSGFIKCYLILYRHWSWRLWSNKLPISAKYIKNIASRSISAIYRKFNILLIFLGKKVYIYILSKRIKIEIHLHMSMHLCAYLKSFILDKLVFSYMKNIVIYII